MKQRTEARKSGRTRRTAKAGASRPRKARPFALPAECAIACAPELRSGLLARLSDAGTVRIDAKRVRRIDTASLQVLAAFARDRRAADLAVEWIDVPACMSDAAALLDLSEALNLEDGSDSGARSNRGKRPGSSVAA